ncbi:MAG: cardiolipin synthase ClsB [Candidatus Parcubacteria bacterium]|nr:cardiolipin synthase ClsB [Burkholderiales bacterium]
MLDYVGGNRLTLLKNGEQYFPALVAAIDGARSEVFLETYIFSDDGTGRFIADALARAARRGVAAHLLIDGFGAKSLAPHLREQLGDAGAEVLVFRPQVSPWPLWKQRSRLRRMHRKLASIDGAVAFVGGINIIDDSDTPVQTPPRYDYAVRIEGPLAARVRSEASRLWTRVSWAAARRWPRWSLGIPAGRHAPPEPPQVTGGKRAALVVRDSLHHRRDIEEAYLELIDAARSEVVIACAYFFPGRRFRTALTRAARRGVSVTVLLQGKVEYMLLYYAARALYRPLLLLDVKIHEYHRSFLHAKVAVFDGRVACVGSSNIDPFSLLLAREANVFVDDAEFAGELRASLHDAIENGSLAVPRRRRRLPFLLRAKIWFSYRIARLLLAFYGYDRQH